MAHAGKASLELVTQLGQFAQILIVLKRLAKACLIITKLGLGD